MDIKVDDEWSKVQILNESDLSGMDRHPLPKEGILGETSIEGILEKMLKDHSIPLNDTGSV